MEILWQLFGKGDSPRTPLEPLQSEEGLLSEKTSDDHQDDNWDSYSYLQRAGSSWRQWLSKAFLLVCYSAFIFILAGFTYNPSDKLCSDKLSMWCQYLQLWFTRTYQP